MKTVLLPALEYVRAIFDKQFRTLLRGKRSYSQYGEDIILLSVFNQLRITKPSYLDIGAHHPSILSNTCYFYENGCNGVNVEPDPYLFKRFKYKRKRDVNLNVGIGFGKEETVDFYIMSARVLNTFSKEEAERVQALGKYKIEKKIKVQLVNVNSILEKYFNKEAPDFISIDVEGLDLDILKSFDFNRFRPKVFCIETSEYNEKQMGNKNKAIFELMNKRGYFVYMNTSVNTVFADNKYKDSLILREQCPEN